MLQYHIKAKQYITQQLSTMVSTFHFFCSVAALLSKIHSDSKRSDCDCIVLCLRFSQHIQRKVIAKAMEINGNLLF